MNIYIPESRIKQTLQAEFKKGVKPTLSIMKFSLNEDCQNRIFVLVASQIKLDCITCHVEKKAFIDFKTRTVTELEDDPSSATIFCDLDAFAYHELSVIADTDQSIKEILNESELSNFTIEQVNPLVVNVSPRQLCHVCGYDSEDCEQCEDILIHTCPTCKNEVSYQNADVSNLDEYACACVVCDTDLYSIELVKLHPLEFKGKRLNEIKAVM